MANMDALSILALGLAQSSGGGGGTSDYSDLSNKPQINSITLSGNKSLSDLGIQEEIDGNTILELVEDHSGNDEYNVLTITNNGVAAEHKDSNDDLMTDVYVDSATIGLEECDSNGDVSSSTMITPTDITVSDSNAYVEISPSNGISVASGTQGMPDKGIFINPGMNTIDIIGEDTQQLGMMPTASLGVSQDSELTVNGSVVALQSDIPAAELPTITGNANKVLKVNSGATAVEWANESTELPAIAAGDAGKVLKVNSGETGVEWGAAGGGGGSINGINELTVSNGTSNIGIGIGDKSLGNVLNGTGYIDSNVIQTSGDVLGSNKQVNINVGTDTFWANAAIGSRFDTMESGTNSLVWKSSSTVANALIASRLSGGNSNQEALQTSFANQNLIHGMFYGRYSGFVGGDNNTCFGGADTAAQYESSTSNVNAPYYNFGNYNNVMGYQLQNKTDYATVIGKNNVLNTNKAFVIGNGADNSNRSNALTVDWDGNLVCNNIPAPPAGDGTYNLQCTISSGVATYTWVAQV